MAAVTTVGALIGQSSGMVALRQQISRVLGRQYSDEVGPWRAYLRVISGTQG